MNNMHDSESEAEYLLLGTGTWRDLVPRLPRPVFALGANEIYEVLVHGNGFKLLFEDGSSTAGFFTTRFVAASTARDAERIATDLVQAEWQGRGHEKAAGSATLAIEELVVLNERFRLRSATGFVFYAPIEDCDDSAASKSVVNEA